MFFCDNTISDDRYEALTKYFENQASKLKEEIQDVFELISKEEEQIELINTPSSVNDLNAGFHDNYLKRKTLLDKEVKKYRSLLTRIKSALIKKVETNIYSPVTTIFSENGLDSFFAKLLIINETLELNNKFTENFVWVIENERLKYKNHLVAKFLKQKKYLAKQTRYDKAISEIEKLNIKVGAYEKQIDRLIAMKKSDEEGCMQFNSFVQSFLSREDIEVKLNTDTKKFNLMRGDELAQNLSEGEKMAISFSHFLVQMKSTEQKGDLGNYIIFIDDPISSLDSNHVFQINSLLREVFFDQTPDTNNPEQLMWGVKCKQLFISTHNFEFFNLLKELPKKHFKKDSRYYISRQGNKATIEKLPKVYNTFSSEYHFLFSEIRSFNRVRNKGASSKLLTIPNILRRFVEMYTLTKFPSNDDIDVRAVEVFGKEKSKRILKLLHHFSHFNSIDRLYKHSESVADIEYVCKEVINHIETEDKMHYNALIAALK